MTAIFGMEGKIVRQRRHSCRKARERRPGFAPGPLRFRAMEGVAAGSSSAGGHQDRSVARRHTDDEDGDRTDLPQPEPVKTGTRAQDSPLFATRTGDHAAQPSPATDTTYNLVTQPQASDSGRDAVVRGKEPRRQHAGQFTVLLGEHAVDEGIAEAACGTPEAWQSAWNVIDLFLGIPV